MEDEFVLNIRKASLHISADKRQPNTEANTPENIEENKEGNEDSKIINPIPLPIPFKTTESLFSFADEQPYSSERNIEKRTDRNEFTNFTKTFFSQMDDALKEPIVEEDE